MLFPSILIYPLTLRKNPLVLLASVFILSSSGFAALTPPWFSFGGTWSYDATTNALTTTITPITTIRYRDGSYDGSPYDTIRGGKFILGADNGSGGGVVYNGGADSLVFGSSVGGTGAMNFSVFEGSTNYFNGTMYDFVVTKDSFGTRLNPNFDADHIQITSTNSGVGSEFIADINSFPAPWANLYMQFTCSSGDCTNNNFTGSASGTLLAGKLSIVPEPLSLILFVTGGATLAFRRYINKIK